MIDLFRLGSRGSVAVLVAVCATVLIGFVGLAADGGAWYLASQRASTAADLSALAGASARERGASAISVATNTASRNGFAAGGQTSIVVRNPPTTGSYAGNTSAVEVIVSQVQRATLSRMFMATPPTVRRRAVAYARTDARVCALALAGGLSFSGSSTTLAPRCVLASNAPSPSGISINSNSVIRTAGLLTTGVCEGCMGDVWTDASASVRPLVEASRLDPIRDPYENLSHWLPSLPACRSGNLNLNGGGTSTSTVSITPAQGAICRDISVGPSETLNLSPGIYYFNAASLDVKGTITGNGVTLVFTGNPNSVGTLHINAQSTTTLHGPTGSLIPGYPEAAGLVAYRDARATNNGSNDTVRLNGGATMNLFGGLYFPTSNVVANGNSASNCMSLVGSSISFSGSTVTQLDATACTDFTPYAQLRVVRLVE